MATKSIEIPHRTAKVSSTKQRRIRKIFGNIHEISEMPNLIEVQRAYELGQKFLDAEDQRVRGVIQALGR